MATPFNLNHFYYFYEVARNGSFTGAARELMISQSALSIQIKSLENSLGGPLFDRRRGGVDLTDTGQRAFQVAERVFNDIDELMADLQASDRHVTGAVSIATVNGIGIYLLPQVLSGFKQEFPNVRVRVDFQEGEGVIDLLNRGKVDFALVPWNRNYPDLIGTPLRVSKMFLVAHPVAPAGRAGAGHPAGPRGTRICGIRGWNGDAEHDGLPLQTHRDKRRLRD